MEEDDVGRQLIRAKLVFYFIFLFFFLVQLSERVGLGIVTAQVSPREEGHRLGRYGYKKEEGKPLDSVLPQQSILLSRKSGNGSEQDRERHIESSRHEVARRDGGDGSGAFPWARGTLVGLRLPSDD